MQKLRERLDTLDAENSQCCRNGLTTLRHCNRLRPTPMPKLSIKSRRYGITEHQRNFLTRAKTPAYWSDLLVRLWKRNTGSSAMIGVPPCLSYATHAHRKANDGTTSRFRRFDAWLGFGQILGEMHQDHNL
jgi:hypothetical protein